MVLNKLPFGKAFLGLGTWALVTVSLPDQSPAFAPGGPGFAPSFGTISSTFGATGLGTGPYGSMPRLSLGISGGGGGNGSSGVFNRYGRLTSLADQEPPTPLDGPLVQEDRIA